MNSMHTVWLTDLHLNFVTDEYGMASFVDQVDAHAASSVLIGGDIAEADTFAHYLEELAANLRTPIYFVLGNHDYYRGSIASVRDAARTLSRCSKDICWLPDGGVVPLGKRTALVGHGGWGDGRSGDFMASDVLLNDYSMIRELREINVSPADGAIFSEKLRDKLRALGDEAAAHFRDVLREALAEYDDVIVLTHVPPFREACWHEGQLSDDNWTPHFVCQAAGVVLVELMEQFPDKRMTVLCGHTHSRGEAEILSNLRVLTGRARYGEPEVQQVLEVR